MSAEVCARHILFFMGILTGYQCLRSENNFVSTEIGASNLFPEAWCVRSVRLNHLLSFRDLIREEYLSLLPESERHDTTRGYEPLLRSSDKDVQLRAAKAWVTWEFVLQLQLWDFGNMSLRPLADIQSLNFFGILLLSISGQTMKYCKHNFHVPCF